MITATVTTGRATGVATETERSELIEQMLARLASAGFPGDRISLTVVKSHGRFVVTHLAPLEVSPAAKKAFWDRTDRIVERARAGG